mmetsp:Transcript_20498/g.55169  ORF Transcript_20498/g.55169 Transcript_20498/m.55169 type:complete len:204 (+) Transcript_20498:1149-1760(+)
MVLRTLCKSLLSERRSRASPWTTTPSPCSGRSGSVRHCGTPCSCSRHRGCSCRQTARSPSLVMTSRRLTRSFTTQRRRPSSSWRSRQAICNEIPASPVARPRGSIWCLAWYRPAREGGVCARASIVKPSHHQRMHRHGIVKIRADQRREREARGERKSDERCQAPARRRACMGISSVSVPVHRRRRRVPSRRTCVNASRALVF